MMSQWLHQVQKRSTVPSLCGNGMVAGNTSVSFHRSLTPFGCTVVCQLVCCLDSVRVVADVVRKRCARLVASNDEIAKRRVGCLG